MSKMLAPKLLLVMTTLVAAALAFGTVQAVAVPT